MTENFAERCTLYIDQSQKKGDFVQSRRLIHQRAIVRQRYDAELSNLVEENIRHQNERTLHTHKTSARKFDFFILPTLRAGTTILEQILDLHPEIIAPPKPIMDEALLSGIHTSLLTRYRNSLTAMYPLPKKAGFVFHRFLFSKSEIEAVASAAKELFETSSFLQVVRDPVAALLSEFNHHFICAYRGEYDFRKLGLAWPNKNGDAPKLQNPSSEELDKFFHDLVPKRILYSTLGEIFERFFPENVVLDFEELKSDRLSEGLTALYQFLGVTHHSDPLFQQGAINSIVMLMEKNILPVTVGDQTVPVALGYAERTALNPSWDRVELAWCDATPEAVSLGVENTKLCLSMPVGRWEAIPFVLRKELLERDAFQRILNEVLLPNWLDNYRLWELQVNPLLRKELSASMMESVKRGAAFELKNFFNRHPEFSTRWEIARSL